MATDVNPDSIKAKWARDVTTLGVWLTTREPLVAEMAAGMGYDYACVDMQHGLADLHDAFAALQATSLRPTFPIVRVPWNEQGIIGRALDFGALGVIIPMVNSPEEAEAAVAACRYAPEGRRSVGPVVPNNRYGAGYFAGANRQVACIPMIETETAVNRIDEILSVPGIDAVYVGPADLSVTLGLPPSTDQDDERFDRALATIVTACRRHGVTPGIHASAALAGKRHTQGFRMITVANDMLAAIGGLRAEFAAATAGVSGRAPAAASPSTGPKDPYSS